MTVPTNALMTAVKHNDLKRVQDLLAAGVAINTPDANGDYALILAAYEGRVGILQALLAAGADVKVLDPGMQATALHAAAYAGRTEAVKLLIDYGIDLDYQGPYNGYTALHDAIWQNHVATAQVLIEAGARLDIPDREGQTPITFAQRKNRQEILQMITHKLNSAQD